MPGTGRSARYNGSKQRNDVEKSLAIVTEKFAAMSDAIISENGKDLQSMIRVEVEKSYKQLTSSLEEIRALLLSMHISTSKY